MRLGLIIGMVLMMPLAWASDTEHPGKKTYDYFCYQCHGYNGDAKTLASTYLTPPPRDFTRADPAGLTRAAMITAVTHGKPGTAMSSFSRVLKAERINEVVDFIRQTFMSRPLSARRYHTSENGWPEHDRYAAAFPFARGDIPLDTAWNVLTETEREGKRLYLEACVSCHDHANAGSDGPVWSPRAVSYPRQYYVYDDDDDHHSDEQQESEHYPELAFELHEQAPKLTDLSILERQGERIYQTNCAFCHAEDGSGLNWIGSFLEPHPPDLTLWLATADESTLRQVIEEGIEGTSMPAWRDLLSEAEISAVVAYVRRAFKDSGTFADDAPVATKALPSQLKWQPLTINPAMK